MSKPIDPKEYVQFDNPKSGGCGMGCWAIGCTGALCVVLMLCGGGFYGIFYSSLPLKMIEAAIEEDGEVEIEGLEGNLTSGFKADEFKFRSVDDKWSVLKDIKFKYSGGNQLFGSDSIIIEEVSCGGGTIYAEWDPEDAELNLDGEFDSDFDDEDFQREFQREFRNGGVKEIRVDLVRISNLKIVNPNTDVEISLDDIKFEGFQYLEGELVNLGDLLIRSSQLDVTTVDSIAFSSDAHSRRFEGTLRKAADHRLKQDVPFVVEYALNNDFESKIQINVLDGRVVYDQGTEVAVTKFANFKPLELLEPKSEKILPTELNLELKNDVDSNDFEEVDSDGFIKLGKTHFSNMSIEELSGRSYIVGNGTVDDQPVKLYLSLRSRTNWSIRLSSEADWNMQDLWAKTVYGKLFDRLTVEEQLSVEESLPPVPPAVHETEADTDETEESAVEGDTETEDAEPEDALESEESDAEAEPETVGGGV